MSLPKKIFLGSTIIFLAALLFWGAYNLSFKKTISSTIEAPDQTNNTSEEVLEDNGRISRLTDDGALAFILSEEGTSIFYYAKNGQVFEVDLTGKNKKSISETILPGLKDVSWSPNKSIVLSEFRNGENKKFSFFDYLEKKGGSLSQNIRSVIWQNNERILYAYQDSPSKSGLFVSNFNGSDWKKLTDLENPEQKISLVPRSGLFSFWNNPDGNVETKFFSVSPLSPEKNLLFSGKFGADYLWSPKGNKVLVSYSNGQGGRKIKLGIMGPKGDNFQELGIPTFVSKCAWSKDGETVYYALPGSIPDNVVLPNDYNNGKVLTADTFWKINLKDGKRTRLLEVSEIEKEVDADKLLLSEDESLLFFINRRDENLYKIAL